MEEGVNFSKESYLLLNNKFIIPLNSEVWVCTYWVASLDLCFLSLTALSADLEMIFCHYGYYPTSEFLKNICYPKSAIIK